MTEQHDVVVVGAGLSGLAAARQLAIHDVDVVVVESADAVGGRVRSDRVDGLTLDHGFQLYNPAYPEAARVLDHEALDLRAFEPGLIALTDRGPTRLGDPRRLPGWAPDAISLRSGRISSKVRFASYAWRASRLTDVQRAAREDMPTAAALLSDGIDPAFIDAIVRPFLAGVFLEDQLSTSRRFLDLVLTSFVRGTPSVPARGMQAIPEQLHDALPAGTVRLGERADQVSAGSVRTPAGSMAARCVIVAASPPAAAHLLPGLSIPKGRDVTTWYYVADIDPSLLTGGRAVLVVDGRTSRGPVINTVVLTHAAPEYASAGRTLVSASALGLHADGEAEARVREHLAQLYGVGTRGWSHVATYPVPYALPGMDPPLEVRRPVVLREGLLVAGDHRDTASIQGAMVSGRRAADAALAQLGVRRID